ncbi:MAG: hypothetical protein M1813_001817 [Trichoglossum hirsutum]|nr:MAG: hypothetical protein M1813_001817 [Trichoglossum hirsutum]
MSHIKFSWESGPLTTPDKQPALPGPILGGDTKPTTPLLRTFDARRMSYIKFSKESSPLTTPDKQPALPDPILNDDTRPITPPLSLPPSTPSSTPTTARGGSTSTELATARAEYLLGDLRAGDKILDERPGSSASMLDRFLARMDDHYHKVAETMRGMPALSSFIRTAGKGKMNEDEFSDLVSAVVGHLADSGSSLGVSDIRYVWSGAKIMQPRAHGHPWLREGEPPTLDGRLGLKPDFFTSLVEQDTITGEFRPISLSTILHHVAPSQSLLSGVDSGPRRSDRIASRPPSSSITLERDSSAPVLKNNGLFTWDDVQVLWEVKSSKDINNPQTLSNLILKAAEVLRFQWYRRFVLGFLVCGKQLKIVWLDRSRVLVGSPVDIGSGDGAIVLIKSILAALVLPPPDIGIPQDFIFPRIVLDDGKPRLVVSVGGQKFVLGDQIVGQQRDHLISRATCVHLARGINGDLWNCCYKVAWPYAVRTHEGSILQELQGVPGVAQLLAWDSPRTVRTLTAADIFPECHIRTSSTKAPRQMILKSTTNEQQLTEEISSDDHNDEQGENHAREPRQTVTEYIEESFVHLDTLDILRAWRSLYLVVNELATKGWVHRDLSWGNVRIQRHNGRSSLALIDFDLAARIVGPTSGAPDKTGTTTFMPIEILSSDAIDAVRHQELHEDEAVFWIGFLALISSSKSGRDQLKSLENPRSLRDVANAKFMMISQFSQKKCWLSWFAKHSLDPIGVNGSALLRELCSRIVQIQFGAMLNPAYPGVDELDEQGCRKHATQHAAVLREIVEELDEVINFLQEVGGGGESAEKGIGELEAMGQALKI